MNFVLTGHKGLIGSSLLERLLADGHTPVGLVDLRATPSIDIRNLNLLAPTGPVDVVYHLASFCKIRDCIISPRKAFEHNVRGTYEVVEFARKHKAKKIVFTSSTRVLYPEKNSYTASKLYGEELVKSSGLEWVVVRPSTVYGPFNDKTGRVTHQFITAAMAGRDLIVYGDKNKTLDFTYVDDFVNAFMKVCFDTNGSYDIGTGTEVRVCDVAQLIIDLVGIKSKIIFAKPERLQPQQVVIDTDVICPTSVAEGMTKTVAFYKDML